MRVTSHLTILNIVFILFLQLEKENSKTVWRKVLTWISQEHSWAFDGLEKLGFAKLEYLSSNPRPLVPGQNHNRLNEYYEKFSGLVKNSLSKLWNKIEQNPDNFCATHLSLALLSITGCRNLMDHWSKQILILFFLTEWGWVSLPSKFIFLVFSHMLIYYFVTVCLWIFYLTFLLCDFKYLQVYIQFLFF